MSIVNLLSWGNYFGYNKILARKLSPESAIMIGLFCDKLIYYSNKGSTEFINGDEYFFCTRDTIFEETGLKVDRQRAALSELEKANIISIKRLGIPSKNYYCLHEKELEKFLNFQQQEIGKATTGCAEKPRLDVPKSHINNTINKKTENKEKESVEQSSTIPYKEIIDYLNSVVGTNFRASSKETQKHISARIREGYTLSDFKAVIDVKYKEWGKDTKMFQYLRPNTLFGTKFESYLNQAKVSQSTSAFRGVVSVPAKPEDFARDEKGELLVY